MFFWENFFAAKPKPRLQDPDNYAHRTANTT